MSLQALIFDVDGTLADTEKDGHRVAFNKSFADAGLDWEWPVDLYRELLSVTGGKERIRYFLEQYHPEFEPDQPLEDFLKQLHLAKNAHYANMLARGEIALRPGVRRLIDEARQAGLRLAIATTTSPENVEALLSHAMAEDAMDWFEVIAAGDVVPAKKPAPDIYHLALEQLGLPAGQCLALEDSRNGILASQGAGIGTVITVNDYTRDHDFSGALLVVDQMGEPDQPFTVLAGDAGGKSYLDIDLLKRLHGDH